jgi:hypothetical protein
MTDFLQWLNLLLIPTCVGVLNIVGRLSRLEAVQKYHGARLARIDGITNN